MAKEQVSSILRALEILECFMDNETEWTLKRLVAQLDRSPGFPPRRVPPSGPRSPSTP